MLVRIPVYVFQGTAASLLPNLTTLNASDDAGCSAAPSGAQRACSGRCALIVAFAATIGPAAMCAPVRLRVRGRAGRS